MATKIVTKNSSTASAVPTASDLVQGELAVNVADKRLFTENNAGAIVELGTNPSALTVDGNVGIGTGSPVSELDVAGTTPTLTIKDTQNKNWTSADTTLGELAFRTSDTSGIGAHNVSFVRAVNEVASGSTPSGALSFGVAASNANASEAMRIDSSGNVGIGTSSPFFTTSGRVSLSLNGSNSSILAFGKNGSSENYILADAGGFTIANTSATLPTTFFNNGAERMRIDSAGNVQIKSAGKLQAFRSDNARSILVYTDNDASTVESDTDPLKIKSADRIQFETGGANERMRIDSAGSVGIGNTVASTLNSQSGYSKLAVGTGSGENGATIYSGSNGVLAFANGTSGTSTYEGFMIYAHADNSMRFGTGHTERMRIDSSGNVGIGTSSATSIPGFAKVVKLEDSSSASYVVSGGVHEADFAISSTGGYLGTVTNAPMRFVTNSTERMRIDSAGLVSIKNNTAPTLRIENTDTSLIANQTIGDIDFYQNDPSGTGAGVVSKIRSTNSSSFQGEAGLAFHTGTTSGLQERMRISSAGNVGIGTSSPTNGKLQVVATEGSNGLAVGTTTQGLFIKTTGTTVDYNSSGNSSGEHTFSTGNTERMRIDAAGNLLVGKTTTGVAGAGTVIRAGGELFVTRAGDVMNLNRLTSDGPIAYFRKDGAVVGSIGSFVETYLFVGSSGNSNDTYLGFYNGTVRPVNASGTNRDNAIDLGTSSARFDDIYATNGTIQTSDRNEKQDIAELSDAEQRVAVACKGLLRKFRWKDSVAEKGDEARTHFGIIAQDLQDAFAAEGLDAGDYAMFISSTWTDEETNEEKTRMGVRYSELLAFIIAAL